MTETELFDLYWNKRFSLREIAKEYNFSDKTTVSRLMKKYNIPLREAIRRRIEKPSKEKLHLLYIIENKSTHKIAKQLNCSQNYIMRLLKEYNIKTRNKEQARLEAIRSLESRKKVSKKAKEMWRNKEHIEKMSLIRGGTGIPYEFSKYPKDFTKKLKEKIRKRDCYICQGCEMSEEEHLHLFKSNLSIHHIDYNKFNNIMSNLITLCFNCNSKANFNKENWIQYFMEKIYENSRSID